MSGCVGGRGAIDIDEEGISTYAIFLFLLAVFGVASFEEGEGREEGEDFRPPHCVHHPLVAVGGRSNVSLTRARLRAARAGEMGCKRGGRERRWVVVAAALGSISSCLAARCASQLPAVDDDVRKRW